MTVEMSEQVVLKVLHDKATRLRIDSVRSTTEAGSGHPTSCASAAEIMSVLFYSVMRYDPRNPHNRDSDDGRKVGSCIYNQGWRQLTRTDWPLPVHISSGAATPAIQKRRLPS